MLVQTTHPVLSIFTKTDSILTFRKQFNCGLVLRHKIGHPDGYVQRAVACQFLNQAILCCMTTDKVVFTIVRYFQRKALFSKAVQSCSLDCHKFTVKKMWSQILETMIRFPVVESSLPSSPSTTK